MAHTSEYEIEDIFIDRLEGIGYKFIKLNNYDEVLANFREQLAKFNAKKLEEKGHTASFSDSEFKSCKEACTGSESEWICICLYRFRKDVDVIQAGTDFAR